MDVLKNKTYKSYDKISRYSHVPYYYHDVDMKYTDGISLPINKYTRYTTYKILEGDTLDSIALAYYGNPSYYWVLADFNFVGDSFAELRPGAIMRIPVLSNIEFEG